MKNIEWMTEAGIDPTKLLHTPEWEYQWNRNQKQYMGTPYIGAILDFLADDYTIPRLTLKESDWLESILRQLNIFYKSKVYPKGRILFQ